jgi:Helicase associated domain.
MARYLELVEFKEKNGHARVPSNDKNLGVWVGTQRKQYRLKQKGLLSHMTDERIEMLDKIGFIWEVNTWNDRYDELKEFYEENGHFSVPSGRFPFVIITHFVHFLLCDDGL